MPDKPNWRTFYAALSRIAPKMLSGVHPDFQFWIKENAYDIGMAWVDSLYDTLEAFWEDPYMAVKETLEIWVENVKDHLEDITGPFSLIPWGMLGATPDYIHGLRESIEAIELQLDPALVAELVAAACQPSRDK